MAEPASQDEIVCYVHAVSPVKKATKSDKKYFNCTLQRKDDILRAVCFTPQKHSELNTLQQTKSPVKITNYGKSNEDIILNNKTKITPNERTNIDFNYSDEITASGVISNISSLNNIASEQLITIKAQVVQISGVKSIHTQHQGILKKQEILIRDTTSSIKVILWESNVDTLSINTTYLLKNLKMKISRNEKYLNITKDEEFQFTETTPFNQPLIEVDDDLSNMASSTIYGKIIGILQVTNSICCVSCNKKVIPCPGNDGLGECRECSLTQIITSCGIQWYLRVLIQSSTNPSEKRRLTLFNQQVQELLKILSLALNPNTASQTDMKVAILQANKQIKVTYNSDSYKVQDITN